MPISTQKHLDQHLDKYIRVVEDEEDLVMKISLTAQQAEKLSKQGYAVFRVETYLEVIARNFTRYYTLVNTRDLLKILHRI